MADEEEADAEPAVELGEGEPVEGAPLARVTSRLTWPIKKSRLETLEGDAVIRTPDGPTELSAALEDVDITYFEKRQEFEEAVRDVVGRGPVATVDE
ncbi:DUF5789 family protein [Haloarchaeobius iranensis]|uniref:Uncharacterized protein n=1 Tax=Haloarchaeobius iranensis TaxID=996166 RepID=A0A1G9T8I2_9EURY|nr:DUF5789 family protein [Haloarchaeobius iranensis]SDM43922.1 hypothetical protein SAMN05192554_102197 [Haloarchaeobius iranensis]